jgi:hypothetical protein
VGGSGTRREGRGREGGGEGGGEREDEAGFQGGLEGGDGGAYLFVSSFALSIHPYGLTDTLSRRAGDERRAKSYLASSFPTFAFEDGFAEEGASFINSEHPSILLMSPRRR